MPHLRYKTLKEELRFFDGIVAPEKLRANTYRGKQNEEAVAVGTAKIRRAQRRNTTNSQARKRYGTRN